MDEIELELDGRHEFLRAKINGVEGRFLLDTGASFMSIYESSAVKFRVAPVDSATFGTANGVKKMSVGIAEVRLSNFVVADARVALMPDAPTHESDGLFGKDVLDRFGYRFERDAQTQKRRLILTGPQVAAGRGSAETK